MSERDLLLQQLYTIREGLCARERMAALNSEKQRLKKKGWKDFGIETTADKIQYVIFVIGLTFSVSSILSFLLGFNMQMLIEGVVTFLIFSAWYLRTKGRRRILMNLIITLMIVCMAGWTGWSIISAYKDSVLMGTLILAFTILGIVLSVPVSRIVVERYNEDVGTKNVGIRARIAEIDREIAALNGKTVFDWAWIPANNQNYDDVCYFIDLVETGKASSPEEVIDVFRSEAGYVYGAFDK